MNPFPYFKNICLLFCSALLLALPAHGLAQPIAEAQAALPDMHKSGQNEMEILTTCQMFIYSSIVLQAFDLSSIENQAKSKMCGVADRYKPVKTLEEIAQLFADHGMEQTADFYKVSFDDDYARQVLQMTEIIMKTYQAGYERALREQVGGLTGENAFCSRFINDLKLSEN